MTTDRQSTRHLFLVEPEEFYANPETMDTNHYQLDKDEVATHGETTASAIKEFRAFRDMLVENGVIITNIKGTVDCPDHVFPNWISTHADGTMVVYPMLNPNRRRERAPRVMSFMNRYYETAMDLTPYEKEGRALESTASICMDRVNKKGYSALSPRTDKAIAEEWAQKMGYDVTFFETQSHAGKPVYHTDVVMWIGTDVVGICADCILEDYRKDVIAKLEKDRELVFLTQDQLTAFCGNSLEILGQDEQRMLVMSDTAYNALRDDQLEVYNKHFTKLLHSPLPTLEKYGGGSARCMIMELF